MSQSRLAFAGLPSILVREVNERNVAGGALAVRFNAVMLTVAGLDLLSARPARVLDVPVNLIVPIATDLLRLANPAHLAIANIDLRDGYCVSAQLLLSDEHDNLFLTYVGGRFV